MSTARTRPAGRAGPTRPGRPARRVADSAARAALRSGGGRGTRSAWLLGAAGVLATLALAWAVLFSSLLAARDIAVTGAGTMSAEEVIDAAHVPLGRPLARLDLQQISRSTAAVPAVREVHVYRRWPHTVEIEIVERTPVAVVAGSLPGDWFFLDAHGVVFGLASPPRDPGSDTVDRTRLPQVTAVTGSAAARAAGEVILSLPATLKNQVLSVAATSPDAVMLTLPHHQKVMWGNSARAQRKAAVLKALLVARPSSLYDVSSPDTPTVH